MLVKRLLLGALAAVVVVTVFLWAGLPWRSEVRALARTNPKRTSVMEQRAREAVKAKRKARHHQVWVPLSRVSRHLILAVVAAEDPNFFGHEGIDWDAVRESIEKNV